MVRSTLKNRFSRIFGGKNFLEPKYIKPTIAMYVSYYIYLKIFFKNTPPCLAHHVMSSKPYTRPKKPARQRNSPIYSSSLRIFNLPHPFDVIPILLELDVCHCSQELTEQLLRAHDLIVQHIIDLSEDTCFCVFHLKSP